MADIKWKKTAKDEVLGFINGEKFETYFLLRDANKEWGLYMWGKLMTPTGFKDVEEAKQFCQMLAGQLSTGYPQPVDNSASRTCVCVACATRARAGARQFLGKTVCGFFIQ